MNVHSNDDGNDMAPTFATDQKKAEALNHSRPFDVHKWSNFPEVNAVVEELNKELSNPSNAGSSKRIRIKHIKVVTLDLYVNWLSDPTRYISFHRDKSAYKRNSRYNKIHVSSKIINVIDDLSRLGYIETHKGFYDRALGRSITRRRTLRIAIFKLGLRRCVIRSRRLLRKSFGGCMRCPQLQKAKALNGSGISL